MFSNVDQIRDVMEFRNHNRNYRTSEIKNLSETVTK